MKQEILFQLDIAWQLFKYHCNGLTEAEAMWCKTEHGLQIRNIQNKWIIDWPDTETYEIGLSSIAWIMWHIIYWWKTTLVASKEKRIIEKGDIKWPGSVELAVWEIEICHNEWISFISSLDEKQLQSSEFCKWAFEGQTMYSLALWLNVEFMKNVAEIGAGRFLFATVDK